MELKKRILIAPLNWGLGHATRCIPIIRALTAYNYEPVIASDGVALELLKKEFPEVETVALPSYKVTYSKKAKHFKLKLLKDSPKMLKAIKAEKAQLKVLIKDLNIDGIISDNRLGIYSKKVPSVFISHQLNVLSGSTTWLSTKMHQHIIKKFDACWVPDVENEPSLSGRLGHISNFSIPIKYLGVVSRFQRTEHPTQERYDLMVLLSGPEPQRSMLETQLLDSIADFKGQVLFVKGIIEATQTRETKGHVTVVNYMNSEALETAINESAMVLSRSGYTTILDLAKLGKKAFFIPTPGQFEQEYLAERLDEKGIVPFSTQERFTLDQLDRVKDYTGFEAIETGSNYSELFRLFEGE